MQYIEIYQVSKNIDISKCTGCPRKYRYIPGVPDIFTCRQRSKLFYEYREIIIMIKYTTKNNFEIFLFSGKNSFLGRIAHENRKYWNEKI